MRQRNMLQMKEQNITSEKELNEMELSNLPDKEFKVMVEEILTRLERSADELSRNVHRETENIKTDQS